MRGRLFNHFTRMSPSFYQKRRVGDLMAHATNDLMLSNKQRVHGYLHLSIRSQQVDLSLRQWPFTINWKLTLIALIPMPFMVMLTSYYGRLLHKRFRFAQEAFSNLNDKTQESISGIKVIKTFGQEKEDIEDFTKLSAEVVEKNMRVAKVDSLFDPTITEYSSVFHFSFQSFMVRNSSLREICP